VRARTAYHGLDASGGTLESSLEGNCPGGTLSGGGMNASSAQPAFHSVQPRRRRATSHRHQLDGR